MQRPLSETAWLRKIGTQDSKCPLSSRFVKLQASLLGDSILAYYLTNPISWCSREPHSAFWQMVFSMYPESNNSRTTYRGYLCKGIGLSVFWSNKAPWTLSATQTWKLFLTKTPRLDEAFGLERFSASTPEKLSNLGAFKVPEMIRSGDLSWLTWNVCLNSPGTKKINAQRRLSPLCLHGKCHHPFKAG